MGVKFGMEKGPLLHATFHPHRCNDKGIGPPKLKILLKFYQISEYKRPAGTYPLRDFHEICRVCTSFWDVLVVKIRHAFERQSLCARFRHEGVGAQKRH